MAGMMVVMMAGCSVVSTVETKAVSWVALMACLKDVWMVDEMVEKWEIQRAEKWVDGSARRMADCLVALMVVVKAEQKAASTVEKKVWKEVDMWVDLVAAA